MFLDTKVMSVDSSTIQYRRYARGGAGAMLGYTCILLTDTQMCEGWLGLREDRLESSGR